jgi:hypothetical protein
VRFTNLSIQPRDSSSDLPQTITFEPTGECDAALIELSDGRATFTIVVTPNTGLVHLNKGPAREIPSDREDLDA